MNIILLEQGDEYKFSLDTLRKMYDETKMLFNPYTGREFPDNLKRTIFGQIRYYIFNIGDKKFTILEGTRLGDALATIAETIGVDHDLVTEDGSIYNEDLSKGVEKGYTLEYGEYPTYESLIKLLEYFNYENNVVARELEQRYEESETSLHLLLDYIRNDNYEALDEYRGLYGVIRANNREEIYDELEQEEIKGYRIDDKLDVLEEMMV